MGTQSTTPEILFEYRKSAIEEGRSILFVGLMILAIFGVVEYFALQDIWTDNKILVVIFIAIEVAFFGAFLCYGILNIRSGGHYIFSIDEEKIVCIVPAKGCGDSFVLAISKLCRLECNQGEDRDYWFLCSESGEKFELTVNYNNPVYEILAQIHLLKPGIPVVKR